MNVLAVSRTALATRPGTDTQPPATNERSASETIPHFLCGAIPRHILTRLAQEAPDGAGADARATLEQMDALERGPSPTLLEVSDAGEGRSRKRRLVYDAQGQHRLPGTLVISEHCRDVETSIEAREAFDGCGATSDFYFDLFGRPSIDDQDMPIESTVHYGVRFENAMWNGRQMIFGDGDGRVFIRLTRSLDVIAHELTHGVIQATAALGYTGQTGALNEHLADAFGIMVKQYTLGLLARESDWRIGAELLGPEFRGRAVRSMADPGSAYDDPLLGRDPQPAHMDDYVVTEADHGGVHINSGILNYAFYLAAVGLGGHTWGPLGTIYYLVLTRDLRPNDDFEDFALATTAAAGELYGTGSRIQGTIADAWTAVGLEIPHLRRGHRRRSKAERRADGAPRPFSKKRWSKTDPQRRRRHQR